MDIITFEAPMEPFGKARPRVTRFGTFMPKSYVAKKEELRLACPEIRQASFVMLRIDSYFRRPKKPRAGYAEPGTPCTKKPDIDNVFGAVMDAILPSDQHVVLLSGGKWWSERDEGFIRITIGLTDDYNETSEWGQGPSK